MGISNPVGSTHLGENKAGRGSPVLPSMSRTNHVFGVAASDPHPHYPSHLESQCRERTCLVVSVVCPDYYRTDHSHLKRINILEGSCGCERQDEGLFLEQASRVEEGRAIVVGSIACRTGED